uniref:Nucleolar protein 14 n=1 Tax=Globisporangium ultimum (strain ATCC 200006 / CBS 805.95 / DAOM BR144) TaxID=431595 RepID=K3W6F5_GLOUD
MVFKKKGGNFKVSGGGGGGGRGGGSHGGGSHGGGRGGGRGSAQSQKNAGAKVVRTSSSTGRNPFDVRGNAKAKYEVIGKRIKGQGRNVAEARAEAETKRKKSLGAQFQARNKANSFKDRRLGEQDPTMSLEDKMIARFQTERKRKLRNASAFALHDSDDEDDDELFLTHGGAKIDDYDNLNADAAFEQDAEDDDHDREMDKEIVNKLHFGGGVGGSTAGHYGPAAPEEDGRKKSHKEIMQEVMLKAKMFKAERQKNKSAQEDATDNLDEGFNDIRALLEFRPTRSNGKEIQEKTPMDDFDKLTREFAFEAKAKATERRMSPEETAAKERDRLAELEKKRVARMKGDDDDDSDDETTGKKGKKGKKGKDGKKKQKTPQQIVMPPTDDDLSADYDLDSRFNAAEQDGEDEEGEGMDEDEEEDEEEEEEEEDSEAESNDDDNEEEATAEAEQDEDAEKEDADEDEDEDEDDEEKERKRQEAAEELPFVFPCPESPEELTALFKNHAKQSAANRALIVERIITYYSPRLSVENQSKMKSFFAILIRQFLKYASKYAVHREDLDGLAKHLFALAQQLSDTAGVIVRELLINLFKRLHSTKSPSKWPELSELLLFKALIQIFPTSDLRHNVISPMETLLGESLVNGALESRQDATRALFTCTLMLQITKDKQRFTPEVLVCLKKLVRVYLVASSSLRTELQEWIAAANKDEDLTLPKLELAAASSVSSAAILNGLLGVVDLATQQYAHLASFDELFHPIYLLLHELTRSLFDGKSTRVNETIARLADQLEKCWAARTPLRLQSFAPALLPTFTPKFDENYTLRKDKGADRDKAKLKQLQRQVKRARKGAARELRRDAEFLAREKQQEENARLESKREKQKEIWRWLEEQNATFNEQVKKGGNMLKGGGSGPAKKRRVSKK